MMGDGGGEVDGVREERRGDRLGILDMTERRRLCFLGADDSSLLTMVEVLARGSSSSIFDVVDVELMLV